MLHTFILKSEHTNQFYSILFYSILTLTRVERQEVTKYQLLRLEQYPPTNNMVTDRPGHPGCGGGGGPPECKVAEEMRRCQPTHITFVSELIDE